MVSDGPAATCFGTGLVQVCLPAQPTMPITLGNQTIDTDASPMCVAYTSIPSGVQLCVIAGTMISQPGADTFKAVGGRPLALVSSGDITISGGGTVDVASHRGSPAGAAGNASQSPQVHLQPGGPAAPAPAVVATAAALVARVATATRVGRVGTAA